MIALLFALTFQAFGAFESKNAYELSYPRDNTFCSHQSNRIELMIRGSSKFIESKDLGYGELLFYKSGTKKPELMEMSAGREDTYRLFLGTSPYCSKSHGYRINDSTLAVLFLKENKPFYDRLVIQFFDLKTMTPKNYLHTPYSVDKAIKTENGFAVRAFEEDHNRETGKVHIERQPYIYNEKLFPKWITYSEKGFELDPELTFKKFPWRKSFKDIQDFYQVTGWDPAAKKFTHEIVYLAVNFQARKRCLLFIEKKQPLKGSETWRCQTI